MTDLAATLAQNAELTERELLQLTDNTDADVAVLYESCRYSLMAGGKRIRPTLVLEVCRMFGGNEALASRFGAALEMVHTYSLIHHDLPCMDNDDFRRGKPTNHKVYGEAVATLSGDALLTRAFEVIAQSDADAETRIEAVRLLSHAAGGEGMIGGQIMDMIGEEQIYSEEKLRKLQALKTGALMRVAVLSGLLAAKKTPESEEAKALTAYADSLGLCFQITDDILDVVGSQEKLGKPIGSDAENRKNTFLSFHTVKEAREVAETLTEQAVRAISAYEGSDVLRDLAICLLHRDH